MNPDEKRVVLTESARALRPHLQSVTVPIVDTKGLPIAQNDQWELFSGTLVPMGERLLVATASHCVIEALRPTRYLVMGDHGKFPDNGELVVRSVNTKGDRPDVGFLTHGFDRKGVAMIVDPGVLHWDSFAKYAVALFSIKRSNSACCNALRNRLFSAWSC